MHITSPEIGQRRRSDAVPNLLKSSIGGNRDEEVRSQKNPQSKTMTALAELLPATSSPNSTTLRLRCIASPARAAGPGDASPARELLWLFSVVSGTDETVLYALHVNLCGDTAYVAKLDSAGARPPLSTPSAARALVAAALRVLPATAIHVFARPAPEYLFPVSARRESKKPLGPAQLGAWWLRTLDLAWPSRASRKLVFTPGTENLSGTLKKAADELQWTYGHPFAPDDKAHDVIPTFPDDPKGRILKDLKPDAMVKELWGIAGLAQDAAEGCFLFVFPDRANGESRTHGNAKDEWKIPEVPDETWQSVISTLESGDWKDAESAKESDAKLLVVWPEDGFGQDVVIPGGAGPKTKEEPKMEAKALGLGLVKRKAKPGKADEAAKKARVEIES